MRLTSLFLALATSFAAATAGLSQDGGFTPVLQVNDRVITGYEMEQRIRFLELLKFPGDIAAEAEKGLIEDRLRLQAAKALGVRIAPDQLQAGMAEFAGRANLDTEQFLAAIAEGGVAPETFRDFVEAGLAWREVVRGKFASRILISEAEIDRELSADHGRGAGPRVLISEIILPAQPGNIGATRILAERLAETITSEASFAEAARQNSIAASREQGGKVDWIPLSNLPPQVRGALATISSGQLTAPVPLASGVGLFQLRGVEDGAETVNPASIVVDYALFLLPAGTDTAAELARARGAADTCDDLFLLAKGQPASQLQRNKMLRGQVPGDVLAVLDRLDPNEIAVQQRSGGSPALVMLCERNATIAAGSIDPVIGAAPAAEGVPSVVPGVGSGTGPSRAQVREEITNRRLGQLAEGYLAELKANAIIRSP